MLHALALRAKLFSNYLSSLNSSLFSNEPQKSLPANRVEDSKRSQFALNKKRSVQFALKNGGSTSSMCLDSHSDVVLWKCPSTTLNYFTAEILVQLQFFCSWLLRNREKSYILYLICIVLLCAVHVTKKLAYATFVTRTFLSLKVYMYWMGMGILSSIGIGTGLHTFLLYLGPFIAKVTMAANECGTLNFPTPPYPDIIICHQSRWRSWFFRFKDKVDMWDINNKVRLEVISWGLGTAIGEIPGYLLGRAARLAEPIYQRKRLSQTLEHFVDCATVDDEPTSCSKRSTMKCHSEERNKHKDVDLPTPKSFTPPIIVIDESQSVSQDSTAPRKAMENEQQPCLGSCRPIKKLTRVVVDTLGFWGITLFCAIPNPFFDLAGLAAGHALMPFWKFGLALVVGKALIKSQCQLATVVLIFHERFLRSKLYNGLRAVPFFGSSACEYLTSYLREQKMKIRSVGGSYEDKSSTGYNDIITDAINFVVLAYFIVNIVNSLAQANYLRTRDRMNEENS